MTGLNNITFRAGKVHLYSDFDGTYFPANQSKLHKPDIKTNMDAYSKRMNKFFKSTEGDLHFHITTGRTFGEYETASNLIRNSKFELPLPESFISKNGSDEFIKSGSDKEFYQNGVFPFKYSNPSQEKEKKLLQSHNWDGQKVKDRIRILAKKYEIRLIEADSENSVKDYGNKSLFSDGKLNRDEWKVLPKEDFNFKEHTSPIAELAIGSRNDGNLKMRLIFPPDYGYCPNRTQIYDNFINDLKSDMRANKMKYKLEWESAKEWNSYRKSCRITPEFEGGLLTKLYDTKEAFKKAAANNDLLVVAGDASNDFEMLNPLEYLDKDFLSNCEKNSSHKEFYSADMKSRLKSLKSVYNGENPALKKELEANGFLKKIEELPMRGIVIKNHNKDLTELASVFASTGKIIEIEDWALDDGIKQAVKGHAKKNKSFKNSMSWKFKNSMFKNLYNKMLIAVLGTTSLCALALGYKYSKNKSASLDNSF